MKRTCKIVRQLGPAIAFSLSFILTATDVLAADNASNWRPIFDLVMMWVNFGIFAFIIVKYSRNPLINFLKGQKEKVDLNINRIEEKKEKISAEVKVAIDTLDENKLRMQKLKERIIRQGERRKQEIIDNARLESQIMLEEAKRKIDDLILQAHKAIQAEMVDMAVSLAVKKLPAEITSADNQKFIDQYLTGIQPR